MKDEVKDLKKDVDVKISSVLDDVDLNEIKKNTKIIEVDLERKYDFLRKYNEDKVAIELLDYLIDQISLYKEHEKVKIVLNKKCDLTDNAIHLIKEGLKEEYKKSIMTRDLNNKKQLWLFAIGVFFIYVSFNIPDIFVRKEIFLITGWAPICQMVEIELLPDVIERNRRKEIKRLLKCEILEKTIKNKNVEMIEISNLEDDIK